MRDEPERLVNDDEIIIFIEDRGLENLGDLQLDRFDLRLVDDDDLAALNTRAARLGLSVDHHIAVVDEPLCSGARQTRDRLVHELVEPRTRVLGVDDDLDHARC